MSNALNEIEEYLHETVQLNASDLHITVGKPPNVRVDGALVSLPNKAVVTPAKASELVESLLTEEQLAIFKKEKELDFAYNFRDKARFRVNVYIQKSYSAAALRVIPSKIKTVEELNLPEALHEFARPSQGLVLVVGPSGHGKSTTLAGLIDEINHTRAVHIVTIEDPIEYVFTQDRAVVDQREVGKDTYSFARALRSVFRQDPDVIMVGEMRDLETIATALTAAETGHLVFGTLHTNNAAQTIDRIIDSFPASQQNQIRTQLAGTLLGVVSQRLVPAIKGGRYPAIELMVANAAVRNLIRENKVHQIDLVIETHREEGMIALNTSLANLIKKRIVTLENAEIYSPNPASLRKLV
ncbi:PilT/PilU family type 4a pilus ATPase [Candidatus Parcubacteria bacterium]|nr:MAG: PilT/PilU family type 4a pilus ATPase [Candidatus Parcubacteria bacterium]